MGPRKQRSPLVHYAAGAPPEEVDADGLLKTLPTAWAADRHMDLRRADFADEATWMRWRAIRFDVMAEDHRRRAEDLRARADAMEKLHRAANRKRYRALRKTRANLQELIANLEQRGIKVHRNDEPQRP